MFGLGNMWILIGVLLVVVCLGVHVAVALGITAVLGIYLMTRDFHTVYTFIGSTAYEALRDYVFAVIPLFMLMGEFLGKCGAAGDLYALINRMTRRIPGRLAIATVFANAVFAFVTGVSIAAAAAFSRIALPGDEEKRLRPPFRVGLHRRQRVSRHADPAVGADDRVGRADRAGDRQALYCRHHPGLCRRIFSIASIFSGSPSRRRRSLARVWNRSARAPRPLSRLPQAGAETRSLAAVFWSTMAVLVLVLGTLGGIWFGLFTPTEGAGVGATLALVLAIAKGMRMKEMFEVILSVGRTSAPLLLLLFTAQLYSRTLSMTGITGAAKEFFLTSGLGPYAVLAIMVGIWFVLGCLIDSISIILLTVPVFAPIAMALGFDPIAFGILGILAIEVGLLTPPFGILVFTVRAALPHEATVGEIFRASTPYWICLLAAVVVIAVIPPFATWLPNLGK